MKTASLLMALMIFQILSYAQEKKIVGEWLLTKVESDGRIQKPYVVQEFITDGTMLAMGMELATWSYKEELKSIELKSDRHKDFNGEMKILKLKGGEMILNKGTTKIFFSRIEATKIAAENKMSGVEGLWKIKDSETFKSIKFELPNLYNFVENGDGMSSTGSGTWISNKDDGTLITIGRDELKGRNTIVSKDSEKMVLKSEDNRLFTLLKERSISSKVERLTFDTGEFTTDEGYDRTEADAERLPWRDKMEMMISLVDAKQLTYKFSSLVEDTGTFEQKTFIADIHSVPAERSLIIDDIFKGYDRHNISEDSEFPTNKLDFGGYSNSLYPLEDESFRISGTETVTTPAGTFDCLVIEVAVDEDTRKKLWMIKDKPGIYAKVISEKRDDFFGYYQIYELLSY